MSADSIWSASHSRRPFIGVNRVRVSVWVGRVCATGVCYCDPHQGIGSSCSAGASCRKGMKEERTVRPRRGCCTRKLFTMDLCTSSSAEVNRRLRKTASCGGGGPTVRQILKTKKQNTLLLYFLSSKISKVLHQLVAATRRQHRNIFRSRFLLFFYS